MARNKLAPLLVVLLAYVASYVASASTLQKHWETPLLSETSSKQLSEGRDLSSLTPKIGDVISLNTLKGVEIKGALLLKNLRNVVIDGSHVLISKPVSIVVLKSSNIVLRNLTFDGDWFDRSGSVIRIKTSQGVLLDTVRIHGYNPTNLQNATVNYVRVAESERVRIQYCSFKEKTTPGSVISIAPRQAGVSDSHVITRSYFKREAKVEKGESYAIKVGDQKQGFTDPSNIKISRNVFRKYQAGPVVVSVQASKVVVKNNEFISCSGGVEVLNGNNNEIYNNKFRGKGMKGSAGISLTGAGHSVYNNFMSDLDRCVSFVVSDGRRFNKVFLEERAFVRKSKRTHSSHHKHHHKSRAARRLVRPRLYKMTKKGRLFISMGERVVHTGPAVVRPYFLPVVKNTLVYNTLSNCKVFVKFVYPRGKQQQKVKVFPKETIFQNNLLSSNLPEGGNFSAGLDLHLKLSFNYLVDLARDQLQKKLAANGDDSSFKTCSNFAFIDTKRPWVPNKGSCVIDSVFNWFGDKYSRDIDGLVRGNAHKGVGSNPGCSNGKVE